MKKKLIKPASKKKTEKLALYGSGENSCANQPHSANCTC